MLPAPPLFFCTSGYVVLHINTTPPNSASTAGCSFQSSQFQVSPSGHGRSLTAYIGDGRRGPNRHPSAHGPPCVPLPLVSPRTALCNMKVTHFLHELASDAPPPHLWGRAGQGHEATETGFAYAPVSQAHGDNHIVQCYACCTAA